MSLLICTPMYGGNCQYGYFHSALKLTEFLIREDIPYDFYTMYNESAVHRARNQCVKAFLATDFEFMMFIDGDIEFTITDVANLWNLIHSDPTIGVATGLYRMKRDNAEFAAWKGGKLLTVEDDYNEPFEVDYAGTGFMLIRRDIIQKLCTEENKYEGKDGEMHQVFRFPLHEGIELSEDYAFCLDVRNMGYKVVMDPAVRLGHWGIKKY